MAHCKKHGPQELESQANVHVTWGEGSGVPSRRHRVGLRQQALHEQLQRPGDDDGDRRSHLAHVFVDLHYLLDPGLEENSKLTCCGRGSSVGKSVLN